MKVKGMVQVGGATYRIVRLRPGLYEVVRLLDDVLLGTFHLGPPLAVMAAASSADELVIRSVARTALLQARTSWVRVDPKREPV